MDNFEKEFKEGILQLIEDFKLKANADMTKSLKSSNQHVVNEIEYTSKVNGDKVNMFVAYPNKLNFIDTGRKAGKQPPLNIIKQWCKVKNINEKWAYPIAKKIGDKGLVAQPFLFNIDTNLNKFYSDVEQLLKETFENNIVKEGNES